MDCIARVDDAQTGEDGGDAAVGKPFAHHYLDELLRHLIGLASTQRIDAENPRSSLMFPMSAGKIDWDDVCAWVVVVDPDGEMVPVSDSATGDDEGKAGKRA